MCQNGNFNIYNNGPPFRMDLHTHLQHCAWMRFCHQWLDNWHVIADIIVVVTGFRWKWDYCSRTERLTRRSSCKVRVPKVPQKATDTPLCVCVCVQVQLAGTHLPSVTGSSVPELGTSAKTRLEGAEVRSHANLHCSFSIFQHLSSGRKKISEFPGRPVSTGYSSNSGN